MQHRMMCADCREVDVPDTLLEGSDFLELLGWCCLAVPGLIYCAWRHFNRSKLCPFCSSRSLVREARAAVERRGPAEPLACSPRIFARSGVRRTSWPRALRNPRVRLRVGSAGALLIGCPLLAWSLAAVGRLEPVTVTAVYSLSAMSFAAWSARRLAALRAAPRACRAWDECGRPLRLEQF